LTILDTGRPLSELVCENETRAGVLEAFGLDYCCGGRTTLAKACLEKGIPVAAVVQALERADVERRGPDRRDWRSRPLDELLDHIISRHHVFLRAELPMLLSRLEKVAQVHGERHPELAEVLRVFARLKEEMESHLQKEEDVVFPALRRIGPGEPAPEAAMAELEDEHARVGEALHELHRLTRAFEAPADACATYRLALERLAALETDTHRHMHLENNVLLPRARAMIRRNARR
jgi:regulator of cell morphogenesis and NO signaling